MFPSDIADWLSANVTPGLADYLAEHYAETEEVLISLGISPASELGHLYLHYGPFPVRGWYELAEADMIAEFTEYAEEELGAPAGFVALSSIEGEGVILYQMATGAVFDVEFGQFEALASGALKPVAPSVVEYLRWCKARAGDD
jgi:hypothetical protein